MSVSWKFLLKRCHSIHYDYCQICTLLQNGHSNTNRSLNHQQVHQSPTGPSITNRSINHLQVHQAPTGPSITNRSINHLQVHQSPTDRVRKFLEKKKHSRNTGIPGIIPLNSAPHSGTSPNKFLLTCQMIDL